MTRERHKHPEDEPEPKAAPREVPLAGIFRVRLPGLRPLKDGLPQEHLDIAATTAAEAWEHFCAVNGITATRHEPEIVRLPVDAP